MAGKTGAICAICHNCPFQRKCDYYAGMVGRPKAMGSLMEHKPNPNGVKFCITMATAIGVGLLIGSIPT